MTSHHSQVLSKVSIFFLEKDSKLRFSHAMNETSLVITKEVGQSLILDCYVTGAAGIFSSCITSSIWILQWVSFPVLLASSKSKKENQWKYILKPLSVLIHWARLELQLLSFLGLKNQNKNEKVILANGLTIAISFFYSCNFLEIWRWRPISFLVYLNNKRAGSTTTST